MTPLTDKEKNKKQLISELAEARLGIASLEKSVSELKNQVLELQRSEAKYRTIADNTFDWEFWLGAGADFIYCSPSVRRITGYDPDDFLKDHGLFLRIIHKDDLILVAEKLNRKRIEKGHCEMEFRIVTRTGEEKWIALAFLGIYDENGRYLGIRGSCREIPAPRRLEEERLPDRKLAGL